MQVVCPNCGEAFELSLDSDEAEFVTDCEICCRPLNVSVRIRDGEIVDLKVTPA